jgi:methylmalonyl-CoA mutase cobalamin-binding domain/chain
MSRLSDFVAAVERYRRAGDAVVARARTEADYAAELRERWTQIRAAVPEVETPTGLRLPRVALPDTDEPGEIARYLHEEGLPGRFPFTTAAYAEMYLEAQADDAPPSEEPTRLFAGLGLAEDTNRRFHELARIQRSIRISTAFDGPTLYGLDSDAEGVLGKIGEGGVAIDTVEDVERLYAGFAPTAPDFSVSMTINAPAPILLAMYVAMARRSARWGSDGSTGSASGGGDKAERERLLDVEAAAVRRLRGTIQADILKEEQAQNEIIFPIEASLRFLGDMVEWVTTHMPRWYPISISGYHIAEAGATPVQQAAFTLANGFTYVDLFRERGMAVDRFGPRLSFFLDSGMDVEYLVLGRVCRRLWAIAMRDVFGAEERAQLFRLHTQTSGRSLVAPIFQNNLTRTAVELLMAYANYTNSCHSNSADEPFTTPTEGYVRLASNAQSILLEESGLFRHTMNLLGGSPGMRLLERRVEDGILAVFRAIDAQGGVLPAIENRYFRAEIQRSAHRYESQIQSGRRVIVGLNRYQDPNDAPPPLPLSRTPREKQSAQVERLQAFKRRHAAAAPAALDRLAAVVTSGGNVFDELTRTVEVCSLGQITARLHEIVGHYRPSL